VEPIDIVVGRQHKLARRRRVTMEELSGLTAWMPGAAKTQFIGYPNVVHIPIIDPAPVYPWSLMWHHLNRHPALPLLIAHVKARYRPHTPMSQWLPAPDRSLFPANPEPGAEPPQPGHSPLSCGYPAAPVTTDSGKSLRLLSVAEDRWRLEVTRRGLAPLSALLPQSSVGRQRGH
jgi:hypothetical protein